MVGWVVGGSNDAMGAQRELKNRTQTEIYDQLVGPELKLARYTKYAVDQCLEVGFLLYTGVEYILI